MPDSVPLHLLDHRARIDPKSHPPVRSLYIHIPFCAHKCHYCDFYSFVDTNDQQEVFLRRLIGELQALAPHAQGQPLNTIFIGGGTPSLLRADLWEQLLATINTHFDLSAIRAAGPPRAAPWPDVEFTVECNPESTTPALLEILRAGGVDRISMGAQSFHRQHLLTLQRLHDPDRIGLVLEMCKAVGMPRTSIDLIYAIPGQTLEQWQEDLHQALALGTTHLSCYNLTYEPNTQMTSRLARGEFVPLDDDLQADMFTCTGETLKAQGLERYEVSNYSKPGHQSRHNLAYWLQEQWLAAGPSASAHLWAGHEQRAGGYRTKNIGSMGAYLSSTGPAPLADCEQPDARRALRERIMTGVRLSVGIDFDELLADAHAVAPEGVARLNRQAEEFVCDGLLTFDGPAGARRLRVTDAGWLVADFLARKLMGAIASP